MKKPAVTLSLCLALSSFSFGQLTGLVNSGEIIKQGIALHDEAKYKQAIALYRTVPRADSNYVLALYELALSHYADSNFFEAKRACEEALTLSEDREREPELYNQYANVVDDMGNHQDAIRIYDSALQKYPAFSLLYLNQGTTYFRIEEYAKAEESFKNGLLVNPYLASLHYRLGQAAYYQGKTIPAILSLTGYLMISPEGPYWKNAIQMLSTIASKPEEYAEFISTRKENPISEYQQLEEIINAKIALNKSYKPLISLDDAISRVIQVVFEKIEYQSQENDFWMQYYVPLYKKLFKEAQFEPFVFHCFQAVDLKPITDYNKKNKKKIEAMVNVLVDYLNDVRESHELMAEKRAGAKVHYLYDEGRFTGKGELNEKGEPIGAWSYYYFAGNVRSTGKYDSDGKRTGPWKYFYFNGSPRASEMYENNNITGTATYYYENGVVSEERKYSNDKRNGKSFTFYYMGRLKTEENYKDDKLEGEKKIYYANGQLKFIENYKEDQLEGTYTAYYQNGATEMVATYRAGQLDGPIRGYDESGALEYEGAYTKDKREGQWKRYHTNKKVKSVENYVNGLLEGEYIEYHDNGQLLTKYSYKKGKANGEAQFIDESGKIMSVLNYDDDVVKSARYYDLAGKIFKESKLKSGKIELLRLYSDRTKSSSFITDGKGKMQGDLDFFYPSGKLSERNKMVDGEEQGVTVGYHTNEKPNAEIHFVAGKRSGPVKFYHVNGKLQREGQNSENQAEGEWKYYDEIGNLEYTIDYSADEMHGYRTDYWPNGKKKTQQRYYYGWLTQMFQYDTLGNIINSVSLPKGSGKYTLVHFNGKPSLEYAYANGFIHGSYKTFYFDGSLESQQYFRHGLRDSSYRYFGYGGNLIASGQYRNDKKVGTWKYFTETGALHTEEQYNSKGNLVRKKYYHEIGKLESDMEYTDGVREGVTSRYGVDGNLMYRMIWKEDLPVSFTYEGSDGKLVNEISLSKGTGTVRSFYRNGNPSAIFSYVDGRSNGTDTLFYFNGNIYTTNSNYHGTVQGEFREFHPSGKLKEVLNYENDSPHGTFVHYNAKGIKIKEGVQYNREEVGDVRYFDETGKLVKTFRYYYGELVSVKK